MSNPVDRALHDLERLVTSLAEIILESSDDEILSDARENGENIDDIVASMRCAHENAKRSILKEKLTTARAEVAQYKKSTLSKITRSDYGNIRNMMSCILETHPSAKRKLTLAARNGKEMSDEDIRSLLDDLHDLDLMPTPKKV